MIVLRVVAVCFVSCMMLASAEVNAQDKADQLRSIERVTPLSGGTEVSSPLPDDTFFLPR